MAQSSPLARRVVLSSDIADIGVGGRCETAESTRTRRLKASSDCSTLGAPGQGTLRCGEGSASRTYGRALATFTDECTQANSTHGNEVNGTGHLIGIAQIPGFGF